jgi:drug/metabolite transporter (DMT)-like permease
MYYSLQYLSLSDATAITFLSPSVTAVVGYLLLDEPFSKKNAVAGGMCHSL